MIKKSDVSNDILHPHPIANNFHDAVDNLHQLVNIDRYYTDELTRIFDNCTEHYINLLKAIVHKHNNEIVINKKDYLGACGRLEIIPIDHEDKIIIRFWKMGK